MIHNSFDASFRKFIENKDTFSQIKKEEILTLFESTYHKKIFKLSIILLIWSIIAVSIDSALISGGLIMSVMHGVRFIHFLPEILFFVGNFFAKVWFIYWYVDGDIRHDHALYCGIPYIGSALILGFLLKQEPLFLEALKRYSMYLRQQGYQYICHKLKYRKKP